MPEETWHYLYIEDHNEAFHTEKKIMDEYTALFLLAKQDNLCIFSRLSETGGTHFYFAPGTEAIAKKHKAIPCKKPSRQEVGGLTCGDQTRVESLFC